MPPLRLYSNDGRASVRSRRYIGPCRRSRRFNHRRRWQNTSSKCSLTAPPLPLNPDDHLIVITKRQPGGLPSSKEISRSNGTADTALRSDCPVLRKSDDAGLVLHPHLVCAAVALEVAVAGRVGVVRWVVDAEALNHVVFDHRVERPAVEGQVGVGVDTWLERAAVVEATTARAGSV